MTGISLVPRGTFLAIKNREGFPFDHLPIMKDDRTNHHLFLNEPISPPCVVDWVGVTAPLKAGIKIPLQDIGITNDAGNALHHAQSVEVYRVIFKAGGLVCALDVTDRRESEGYYKLGDRPEDVSHVYVDLPLPGAYGMGEVVLKVHVNFAGGYLTSEVVGTQQAIEAFEILGFSIGMR